MAADYTSQQIWDAYQQHTAAGVSHEALMQQAGSMGISYDQLAQAQQYGQSQATGMAKPEAIAPGDHGYQSSGPMPTTAQTAGAPALPTATFAAPAPAYTDPGGFNAAWEDWEHTKRQLAGGTFNPMSAPNNLNNYYASQGRQGVTAAPANTTPSGVNWASGNGYTSPEYAAFAATQPGAAPAPSAMPPPPAPGAGGTTRDQLSGGLLSTLGSYNYGGANDSGMQNAGQERYNDAEYLDPNSRRNYIPIFGDIVRDGDNETRGPITGYMGYDRLADQVPGGGSTGNWWTGGGSARYEGVPYDVYDASGKKTSEGVFKDMGVDSFIKVGSIVVGVLATMGVGLTVAGVANAAAGTMAGAAEGSALNGLNGADIMSDSFVNMGGHGAGGFGGGTGAIQGGLGAVNGSDIMSDQFVANGGNGAGGFGGGTGAVVPPGAPTGGGGSSAPSATPPTTPSTSSTLSNVINNPLVRTGAGLVTSALGGGGGSGGTGGTGTGTGGGNLANTILGLLAGNSDKNRQQNASDDMLNWLKQRTAITDNLYKPGSDEYNALWDQMSRKDAAAGRNSQYGPRSVDLAGKIAQIKASENTKMTTGIGQWMQGAYNQNANSLNGLLSALGGATGGTAGTTGLINQIAQLFTGAGGTLPGTNFTIADLLGGGLSDANAPGGSNFGADLGSDDFDYNIYDGAGNIIGSE